MKIPSSFINPLPEPASSVLISNATFVLADEVGLANSVLVRDRKIAAIGERSEIISKQGPPEIEIDASGCLVMPGLVNSHSHIAMSLLRGFAEDLPLLEWLKEKIWPAEAKLEPEDIYLGGCLGAVESLLSGTTSIVSIYFYNEGASEADAVYQTGMRGTLAHGVFDWTKEDALRKTIEFVRTWHGKDQGRIRVATSPHAPYSCSPSLLKEIENLRQDLNEKRGRDYPILNTIHVAEARTEAKEIERQYNLPVNDGVAVYLDSLKVLTSDTIAAHSIHLTDKDLHAFARTGASISSCPVSNLKVGMGGIDLPRVLESSIVTGLGTDGPASNNSLDMFETMKMASLLSKGIKGDTTSVGSRKTFELATLGSAKALHQENEIGSLTVGKRADIIIIDLQNPHSIPFYDSYNHIVYSSKSSDVRDVLVDGRIIVRNKQVLTVDLPGLKNEVDKRIHELGFLSA